MHYTIILSALLFPALVISRGSRGHIGYNIATDEAATVISQNSTPFWDVGPQTSSPILVADKAGGWIWIDWLEGKCAVQYSCGTLGQSLSDASSYQHTNRTQVPRNADGSPNPVAFKCDNADKGVIYAIGYCCDEDIDHTDLSEGCYNGPSFLNSDGYKR